MRIIIIIAGMVLLLYVAYRTYRLATGIAGLDAKIRSGAVILDVRTEREFAMGHIEGAVNISLGTLRERYVELDTSQTYITCCSHGLRSVKAVSILKERGFRKVFNGGAWSDLGSTVISTGGRH